MGADFAYLGTKFIASDEANAVAEYKQAIINAKAADILYSDHFSGVHGNYLKESIVSAGLDPDNLDESSKNKMNFTEGSSNVKAWKDIWGAGQGVGVIDEILPVATIVDTLEKEYYAALDRISLYKK